VDDLGRARPGRQDLPQLDVADVEGQAGVGEQLVLVAEVLRDLAPGVLRPVAQLVDGADRRAVAQVGAEGVEGQHPAVGVVLERVPVQVVEVVVLPEGVEGDLPVGVDLVDVGIGVRRPVGEVEHGQLGRQLGPQVLVDVDRRPGAEAPDHQPVALGHRQLDQALLLPAQLGEGVGHGHAHQPALQVVDPGVERAGEAPGLARAVDHPHAAMAAHVGHGPHAPVGGPGDEHGRAAQVDRAVAAGAGQGPGQAEDQRLAQEQDGELLGQPLGRRVAAGRDFEQAVRQVGGPLLDVVQQAAYQAVLQRLSVHETAN
jgi:hypothetical protein